MSDDPSDDDPRDDRSTDPDEPNDEFPEPEPPPDRASDRSRPETSGGWISSLVNALGAVERLSRSGRGRHDRSRLDYDVSVRTGLDAADDRPSAGSRGEGRRSSDHRSPEDRSRKRRKRRTRPSPSDRYHVSTRTHDDELTVTADLSGVDREDVTVGFAGSGSTLVVGAEGRELERVDVPWEETAADATVRNGVLTVSVRPTEDEEDHDL